jgi:2-polyprenyl-6-methoxyphenol hydroxylase-like FAD-dependent oxidoreductase
MPAYSIDTACCIAGGGPAGMMTGLLMARAGIDVIVLEKHADFFRDFRGDTIHPSTFQLMHELGMLEEFLRIPHQEVKQLGAMFNGEFLRLADFSRLRVEKKTIGLMPQWDFLNFLAEKAKRYSNFRLMTESEFTDLVHENGKIKGVVTKTPQGEIKILAKLVIGADGRSSDVREKAGLKIITTGVPIDVLWFRLSKHENDPLQSLGHFNHGRLMVMLDRREYWQCGYVIPKGDLEKIRQRGLSNFHSEISSIVPFLENRIKELDDWEKIKLLSVAIDHLENWSMDGLLCIGDAAHAMSPVGGVGINLALQDAVATANILCKPLIEGKEMTEQLLSKVQKRREFPTLMTQRVQVVVQKAVISRRAEEKKSQKAPLLMRWLNKSKWLRSIPARLIGIGLRPEHIQSTEKK